MRPMDDDSENDRYLDEIDELNDRRNRAGAMSRHVRRRRMTEDARARRERELADAAPDLPDGADRWTTWDDGERGPEPYPDWLRTELGAADRELGVLKTGKEADVWLIERFVPHTTRSCLLAAKRYRDPRHRLFHRDAGYLEGRRSRRSRENRAMANRSNFGRNLIGEQWAAAEFAALAQLWAAGASVPYPVQRVGTEVLLEFVGTPGGRAAPRLVDLRPDPDRLERLWSQLVETMTVLARNGCTHGDLSPYNVLVSRSGDDVQDTGDDGGLADTAGGVGAASDASADVLMLIDLPQVVDVVINPQGVSYLDRDVRTMCSWFVSKGLSSRVADPDRLLADLEDEAGLEP